MSIIEHFGDSVKDLQMPEGWKDVSYHNDACPSWAVKGFQVFIFHADPKKREAGFEDAPRFNISREADYAESGRWYSVADTFEEVIEIVNDKETYREVAKSFMEVHAPSSELSFMEWICKFGDTLKYEEYKEEGDAILDLLSKKIKPQGDY